MKSPSRGAGRRSTPPKPKAGAKAAADGPAKSERVAKVIARAGLASRREAEVWIGEGRVAVNGTVLDSPAVLVGPADKVMVDGKPLPAREAARLWRYHKPPGLITTRTDPRGRPTVFDNLPPGLPRVVSIGRLDMSSEGMLLLTNDGELARHLEMPSTGWSRKYRVRVHGRIDEEALAGLAKGCTVSGVRYGPMDARLERQVGGNAWLAVAIREGKNREVRKVLESLDLTVNRLIRVAYGPFQLADLARGAAEEVKPRVLAEQLGGFLRIERPADQSGHAKAKARPPARRKGPPKPGGKPGGKPQAARSSAGKPQTRKSPAGKSPAGKSQTGKSQTGKPPSGAANANRRRRS